MAYSDGPIDIGAVEVADAASVEAVVAVVDAVETRDAVGEMMLVASVEGFVVCSPDSAAAVNGILVSCDDDDGGDNRSFVHSDMVVGLMG